MFVVRTHYSTVDVADRKNKRDLHAVSNF